MLSGNDPTARNHVRLRADWNPGSFTRIHRQQHQNAGVSAVRCGTEWELKPTLIRYRRDGHGKVPNRPEHRHWIILRGKKTALAPKQRRLVVDSIDHKRPPPN